MSRAPHLGWRLATIFTWLLLLFLVAPIVMVVPLSFSGNSFLEFPPTSWSTRWYAAFAGSLDYRQAVMNSVIVGLPVALLSSIFGTLAAIAIERGALPGRRILAALFVAPAIIPQMVLAIGLYPLMVQVGLIGSFPAVILGQTVICTPLVFLAVGAALRGYAPSYELAAMTLGAGRWHTFWLVTFPMIRPAVVIGFILAFTVSFDELILAMFLASPTTRTMPRLLWEQLTYEMTPTIAAATASILAATGVLLLVAAWVGRRSTVRLDAAP
ncbi:MAG: ABC transporter permease [Rhodospirillales bacterium]|nr:ABC transporter permease [Rhodospirillales bacterium]